MNVETSNATCFGAANGSVQLETYGDGPFVYSLFDANGNELSSVTGSNAHQFEGLEQGFYHVEVDGLNGECASVQREFFIGQPAASEPHELIAFNTECQGDNNGEIQVLLSDSLFYKLELYSNNELIEIHSQSKREDYFSNLNAGQYRVDVLNACDTLSYFTTIASNDSMYLDFELSADTLYLQEGGVLYCENLSEYATAYAWAFTPDQDQPYTEFNGEHVYTEAGTYDVYLFGQTNAGCSRFVSQTVTVVDLSTGIENVDLTSGQLQIRYTNRGVALHYNGLSNSFSTIQLVNELGQVIIQDQLNATSGVYEIPVDNIQAGIYFIQIESANGFSDVKRFVVK